MESAIREMIRKSVDFVVARTPRTYYRYGIGGRASDVAYAPPAQGQGEIPQSPVAPAPESSEMASAFAPTVPQQMPPAGSVLKTIRADLDQDLILTLKEVKRRGTFLSAVVSLNYQGDGERSKHVRLSTRNSVVFDYDTGKSFPLVRANGFTSGNVRKADPVTLRAMFKAPEGTETVGITFAGFGTFDDIELK